MIDQAREPKVVRSLLVSKWLTSATEKGQDTGKVVKKDA